MSARAWADFFFYLQGPEKKRNWTVEITVCFMTELFDDFEISLWNDW